MWEDIGKDLRGAITAPSKARSQVLEKGLPCRIDDWMGPNLPFRVCRHASDRISRIQNLDSPNVRQHGLTSMKSVTVREFYHNAGLVDGLAEGRSLVVTAKGEPKFVVTKGLRPRMTKALAESRSVGDKSSPPFDGVAFLRSLKK